MINRSILLIALIFGTYSACPAQQTFGVKNFIIKENLLKNRQVAVIAADSADTPDTKVMGTYVFSVNGFRQELKFTGGVAVVDQQIERSTFLYIKHEEAGHTASRLYYVVKKGEDLDPYAINWVYLAFIPAAIVILALLFRRFIILALILLIVLFWFNHQQGLHFSTFFETVFDGLKSAVTG